MTWVFSAVLALVVLPMLVNFVLSRIAGAGQDTFKIGLALESLAAVAMVSVPLGLWKLTELIHWLLEHVRVSW